MIPLLTRFDVSFACNWSPFSVEFSFSLLAEDESVSVIKNIFKFQYFYSNFNIVVIWDNISAVLLILFLNEYCLYNDDKYNQSDPQL